MHGYSARAGIVVGPVGIEDMGAKLNKVSVPLLAIWGERDTISPPAVSKILKSHLQSAVVHIIKEAGHPCYLDEPAKFKEIVRNFLKKINQ
jgi:pimeloyl-ACP methyl ester carboxylesterase